MPAKVSKLKGGKCRVRTPSRVTAKRTSCPKAHAQARIINAAEARKRKRKRK